MKQQLELFREKLEIFASKYKKQINEDPEFRKQFIQLCVKIGVDPLASNKGFWGELLGVGDFYYELAVQIVELCLITRDVNGGLLNIKDALNELRKRRKNQTLISIDDIERSVKKLNVLGQGFKILKIGNDKLIQSVPIELSDDHTSILVLSKKYGYVSHEIIYSELKWEKSRVDRVIKLLLNEGIAWVDINGDEVKYYFLTLYFSE